MPVTPQAVEHLGRLGHDATHVAVIGLATVALLDRVLAVIPEAELERSVTVVDRYRIRRRRLPFL
jgi:hypothetical protein